MRSVLFYFALITMVREGWNGYTSGGPCVERNTAFLEHHWEMPPDPVDCVDITSMNTKISIPPSHQIIVATTLYADHMGLLAVPESVLSFMPELRLIDLSGNRLRRVSKDAFLPLHQLNILLLEGNHIIIPKRTPLLNSPTLKTLMLSNNKIKMLRPHTFSQLRALTVLYLDGNRLTKVLPRIFKPLKYLKYLHLGNNRLKVVPNIVLPAPKAVVIVKGNPFNRTEVIKR